MTIKEVEAALRTDVERGLSRRDAEKRLSRYGPNVLRKTRHRSPVRMLISQFTDFMVLVLLGAIAASAALGEMGDALAIMTIVLMNAFLGFIQEYRAERSLEALKELSAPEARVLRDGSLKSVPASQVVPGDILLLEVGDRVAADCRLIEAFSLEMNESALTGESIPSSKQASGVLPAAIELAERRNMIYMGTTATRGRGRAIVVATGMDSEIGRITGLIQEVRDETTPLQRRLEHLGKWLVAACIAICVLISAMGILRGEGLIPMFLAGVSLAVAAIPEGLPAIVTIALAIGVQRMSARHAIVRRLMAVETLGCTTVICSDKTGTLTRNEMTVCELNLMGRVIEISGTGYDPKGEFTERGRPIDPQKDPGLVTALEVGVLCNNARLERDGVALGPKWREKRGANRDREEAARPRAGHPRAGADRNRGRGTGGRWGVIGDPTEGALVVAGAKAGLWKDDLARRLEWLGEIPFDSDRKRMTVVFKRGEDVVAYVKGAPDFLVELCSSVMKSATVTVTAAAISNTAAASPLTPGTRRAVLEQNMKMAGRGLRVLGLAYRVLPRGLKVDKIGLEDAEWIERDLTFIGLAGMIDPPREESKKALDSARRAGVRTIMITGDHEGTAAAVARELGLLGDGDGNEDGDGGRVVTGSILESMSDARLDREVDHINVFARVAPRHKLRIVRSLKRRGEIVAMTGDGVNDAPAIKEADIGIAMGRSGTDVAKEASSMILADDNYATIVAAIEEGRAIYDNIRKFIRYLLACNVGEVLTMLLTVLTGLPLPLLPIQILWINLVTDGLPALALGIDPTEPGVMNRKPRSPKESIFARGLGLKIISQGVFIGLCTVAVFVAELYLSSGDLIRSRSAAFTTLVLSQLFYVFLCRSETRSIPDMSFGGNPYLTGAVLVSCAMQLLAIYLPALRLVFRTATLGLLDWVLVLTLSGWSSALSVMARGVKRIVVRKLSVLRV
ncbi:MAG: cation-translocating P-type ATPase [Firmicutes bacterium]|nr:cation-translocating P-type ATPase [Bacillota bacterium]